MVYHCRVADQRTPRRPPVLPLPPPPADDEGTRRRAVSDDLPRLPEVGRLDDSSEVRIANRAMNGRSTRSFVAEGRWKAIIDSLQPGDYVFIQFGHNDEKVGTNNYSSPDDYRRNLVQFVDEVRAKKGQPVLFTPVVRRKFDGTQLVPTHGAYPDAARAAARERDVPLVDMERSSAALVQQLGPDFSRALWLHLDAGMNPNYPNGVHDDTHFNPLGARKMAGLAIESIRAAKLGLASQLHSCPARP